MSDYDVGKLIVRMHGQGGFPMELGFLTARDMGLPRPSFLGLMCGAAEQGWGRGRCREMLTEWQQHHTPTATELVAMQTLQWGDE